MSFAVPASSITPALLLHPQSSPANARRPRILAGDSAPCDPSVIAVPPRSFRHLMVPRLAEPRPPSAWRGQRPSVPASSPRPFPHIPGACAALPGPPARLRGWERSDSFAPKPPKTVAESGTFRPKHGNIVRRRRERAARLPTSRRSGIRKRVTQWPGFTRRDLSHRRDAGTELVHQMQDEIRPIDFAYQLAFRIAHALLRAYWWFRRPRKGGILVAVWHLDKVRIIKNSYRRQYTLPGGYPLRGESPAETGSREQLEECGLYVPVADLREVYRREFLFEHL